MSLDLINITPREILDLLKAEYYNQTGKTIQIGSDEFASNAVQGYVWPLLFNTINTATINRFIDNASGEFLDAIAANYGITERPSGYHATARFAVVSVNNTSITVPAGSIIVSDDAGNQFSNPFDTNITSGVNSIVLQAIDSGTKYNGIPKDTINTIVEGDSYISLANNTTQSDGGTDGYPYTVDGDNAYREWLKTEIQSFAGAGTYLAYEARAKNADSRVLDVYVLKQDDTDYIKGKVQIFIQTDPDTDIDNQARVIVQASCEDPIFRPIGDLVEVRYAYITDFDLSETIQVTYPERFRAIADSRNARIISEYRKYLAEKINRPFLFSEFCERFTQKDSEGVYAIDAKPLNVSASDYVKPRYPYTGGVINLQSVTISNTFA